MPRYLVERSFAGGLELAVDEIVERNAHEGVTWLHSYVSEDRRRTFDLYESPSPEAIRKTSSRNGLPLEKITEVRVLDPYFYGEVRT